MYAVLLAPEFRLQAVLRHCPELKGDPCALIETNKNKSVILEANPVAREAGIHHGMTLTQATARCAGLQIKTMDLRHEACARDILLQTAQSLAPYCEWTRPGAVTIQLPLEKTFCPDDLRKLVIMPLKSLGLDILVGVGSTPDLALLAAQEAHPVNIVTDPSTFLSPLPIHFLNPSPELGTIFHSWGIHTIGALLALPMTEVCERLGSEALALWQQARGGSSRPLKLEQVPEIFSERTEIESPIETLEPLLFLIRRFLDQLARRLELAYLVAAQVRLTLAFDQGPRYERDFSIPHPTRDVDQLFRLLHTHLENFRTDSPIVELGLEIIPTRPTSEQFDLLERGMRDPRQFAETLGRLQALVGSNRVGIPQKENSHRPDAFRLAPPLDLKPIAKSSLAPIGLPILRFRPPLPAQVTCREGKPVFVASERFSASIQESAGPWIMEGDWWNRQAWRREEWDIATVQDGFYRLSRCGGQWTVEGVYG
jgi:protein ImuB